MAAFLDACRFNPAAGGTTDWTYSSPVPGYQNPTAAGAVNGKLYKYRAESADLSQWELGEGAYNSGTNSFARTTVLFNSSGTTSKINFSTVPQVAIVALKSDLPSLTEDQTFSGNNIYSNTIKIGVGSDAPDTPTAKLYITNNGDTAFALRDSTSNAEMFYYIYAGGGIVGTITNHSMTFRANNADAFALTGTQVNFYQVIDFTMSGSVTPTTIGHMMMQATSNTSLTFKYKGTDGVVRSGSITLT